MLRRTSSFSLLLALTACAAGASPRRAPAPSTAPAAPPITLTYLGVAGWSLSSPKGTLLFDPYVTRAAAKDASAPLVPDDAAIAAYTPRAADGILVSHSHYDHLLDVANIARRTGAAVVGTASTANVVRAGGVPPARVRVVTGGESFDIGPFHVRAVPALHSLTGQPNAPIPADVRLPLPACAYEEGGTLQYLVGFEGRRVYFVGTANVIEENVRGTHADVAIVAIGLREKVPDYTCRLLRALGSPPLVLPNHFDSFREPLHPGKMDEDEDERADLDAFAAEVHGCAPHTRVEIPVPLRPIRL